jgi:hypothetical protein
MQSAEGEVPKPPNFRELWGILVLVSFSEGPYLVSCDLKVDRVVDNNSAFTSLMRELRRY